MADPMIWNNLPRTNNDPTSIDQAIAGAITSHNDDPDAHIGPDRALESHRAAEIIDHLAESVVNDKIKQNARTYIAIVDDDSDADFSTIEDAVDFAFAAGGGSVFIRKGNYAPTRPLKLRYGVDLYGEGPNETSIDLSGLTNPALNFDGNGLIDITPIPAIYYYEGTDIADVSMPDGLSATILDGLYTILEWGDGNVYGQFGDSQIGLWDVAPYDGANNDVMFELNVNALSTSDIVHVDGWELATGLENGEGLTVITGAGELGKFAEYLGNGDIRLTTNAAFDCYRSRGLIYEAEGGRMSVLQSLSVDFGGNGQMLSVNQYKGRVYLRDCVFTDVRQILRHDQYANTYDGRGTVIEDSIFNMSDGTVDMAGVGAIFRNCNFNLAATDSVSEVGGENTLYENCNFGSGMNGVQNMLTTCRMDTRFNNCQFTGCTNGDICNNTVVIVGTSGNYIMFSNCTFFVTGGNAILFAGKGIIVTGCQLYGSSNSAIGLKSTSRYCVFVGNQVIGVAQTQPTNCVVSGNVTTTTIS